jgi:hypothetical protein
MEGQNAEPHRLWWRVAIHEKRGFRAPPFPGDLSPLMKTDTPEPEARFEHFRLTYPSGTVVDYIDRRFD